MMRCDCSIQCTEAKVVPEDGFTVAARRIDECRETKAETLDLGGLQLRKLPSGIGDLTWLKALFLGVALERRNNPEIYNSNYQLRELSRNNLNSLPDDLAELQQLERLDLSGNCLDSVPLVLCRISKLSILNLGQNLLTASGARPLEQLTAICDLNLADNHELSDAGVQWISGLTRLRNLSLGNTGVRSANSLLKLNNLVKLKFSNLYLQDELLDGLSGLTSLRELYIPRPYLSHDDAFVGPRGAAAIGELKNLRKLNVGGHLIGDEGAMSLATLLNLTHLTANSNRIGPRGMNGIANLAEIKN
jgi:Leucine-rich repeat (LRR) protein